MIDSSALQQIKRVIPKRVKVAARDAIRERTFRRAVAGVSALGAGQVPGRQLLTDLITGWGNEGFAAQLNYLEEVCNHAVKTRGPILECGSGLTTIVMGLLGGRRGIQTWSLEHFPAWRAQVMKPIVRFRIPHVTICLSPLRDQGEFDWYSPPLDQLPPEFSLVICDGPPGNTKGGRYGLLPVMGKRLSRDAVILLDDAGREGEAEVLERWKSEMDLTVTASIDDSFAIVRRN